MQYNFRGDILTPNTLCVILLQRGKCTKKWRDYVTKIKRTPIVFIVLSILILCTLIFSALPKAQAWTGTRYDTDWYGCRAHGGYCQHVKFAASGNTLNGDIYDKYFSSSYFHWPNAVTFGKTWSYKVGSWGYAKCTYTAYSSLITQWASIAFDSETHTLSVTF